MFNKQVKLLDLLIKKYDDKFLTSFFDVTNKIEIAKISIHTTYKLSNDDKRNVCEKIYEKIRNLETQNMISNEVSYFIKLS